MRTSHRLCLLPPLLLVCTLAGCWKGVFNRDGAGCSDEGTCPPGQRCSANGQCLFPCPVPDCVGETCGCYQHTDGDHVISVETGGYLCLSDGLCHIKCSEYGDCQQGTLVCGANGLCLPRCGESDGCPNGASCVSSPHQGDYCLGPGADGGVPGDAGLCTDCPGYGCVFLDSDPSHCGRCEHHCLSNVCESGECQPKTLVHGPEQGGGAVLLISGSTVYWTVRESQAVYACHRQGCASPTLICVGPACGSPTALAVTPSQVVFIDEHGGDARILSCPLSGCMAPPAVLADGLGRSTALAFDGSLLYFSSSTGIGRCPEVGCGDYVQEVHGADLSTDTVSLAVGTEHLVFSSYEEGSVAVCPKTGCFPAPSLLSSDPGSLPAAVTPDPMGDLVYWNAHGAGEVRFCPLTGCEPGPEVLGTLASGEPFSHLSSLTLGQGAIFSLDAHGTLRRCAFDQMGDPCDEVYTAGLSVLTLAADHETLTFGVPDGRVLAIEVP